MRVLPRHDLLASRAELVRRQRAIIADGRYVVEGRDITTVVYANRAYDILRIELQRVGAQNGSDDGPGPKAQSLLDLTSPTLDFVRIAKGMGVPARRVGTAEELAEALRWAFDEPGPHLIEAVMPSIAG